MENVIKLDEKLKEKLLNTKDIIRVKVRFNDTDSMGIVHFKKYYNKDKAKKL
ncbi:MAG: hypothetical protein ACFE85_13050 [Candidatus Hodarchaeota archaeon]